ncbi:hypothetical protein VCRA2111O136_130064 [Vibrio crassostreae]|nr:hypothetical protein VCRA2111O136_130064 [Vibrio crassostreae]
MVVCPTKSTMADLLSLSFQDGNKLGSQSLAKDEKERLDKIATDKRFIFFIATTMLLNYL